MATLIQSKQIQGVVTASVIEGNFSVQGQIIATGSNSIFGSITASAISSSGPIYGVRYDDIQGTPSFVGGTGILITQVGDVITITNTGGGDGVSGSAELITSVALLNSYTGSNDIIIVGLQSQIDSLIAATSSYETKGRGIISGSSQLYADLDVRYALSGSIGGGTSDFTQLTNIPSGLVSSSDQILGGTGILSGSHTDISSLNQFTQSIQSQVDALIASTSSYLTSETDSQTLSIVGDQLTISSGNTITIPTGSGGGVSSWNDLTDIPSELVSGSVLRTLDGTTVLSASVTFEQFSASLATEFQNIQHTQIPQGTISSSQQISDLGFVTSSGELTLPSGLISSSQQLIDLGFSTTDNTGSDSQTLTIVGDQLTISDGNTITIPTGSGGGVSSWNDLTDIPSDLVSGSYVESLPSGLISSSEQVLGGSGILSGSHTDNSSLNDYTSSNDTNISQLQSASSSFQSQLDSLVAVTSSYLTSETDSQTLSIVGDQLTISDGNTITIPTGSEVTLPGGLISSSQQISDLGFVTSSEESPFNGDRVVSNTLLGDLYSESYNAGTSGSLREFIEQVFFPSSAPTATFTTQTANLNTNLATDGTNLESISITDTVDDSPYVVTLGGTNESSLTPVPTNADSSSWELRANGDLTAGTYTYDVIVTDSATATRTYSGRTLTIAQASSGIMSTNGTLYIIESATSGVITLSSTGRPGSTGVVSVSYSPNYGSQVATNFTSSNPLISINSSNGQLSVGSPISGSGNLSGDTITSTISWEDQYGNTDSDTISVNVTTNFAPTRSATTTTNNNTNQATGSSQIIRLTVTDTESDSIPNSGLVWEGYNSTYFTPSVTSPYMYLSANNTSIPAGVYPFTASFSDVHGFRTSSYSSSVTINQADNGTLGGDINNYIIESALSGSVLRDQTGFNSGNASQVTVSYSPSYGTPVVQSFTSSNPSIAISNTGHLTLAVDLSGSVTQSGATINSTIGWEDQYGNVDSRAINVTVFGNQSPAASFTDLGLNTETAVSGSHIGTLTITDTETNTPFSASIGGTDGGKFEIVPQNANSSSYYVYPTGSLTQGDYSVQFIVTDNYSETATLNETISVSAANDYGVIYVYTQNLGPAGSWSETTYKGIYGISVENGDTPPEVTSFTTAASMLSTLVNNDVIGDSTITFNSTYTMTLRDTIDGDTTLDSALASNGNISFSGTANILLIYPSGSDMEVPTSIQQTINGTVGGGVPYLNADSGGWGIAGAKLNSITLNNPHLGYSEWFVLGRFGTDGVGSSFQYRIVDADGGSAPS